MLIKSASEIAKKWVTVARNSLEFYEAGVRNPLKDWAKETKAAESRYEAGIKSAILRKAFGKGVDKAGTAKQKSATITKGIMRWPSGIEAGEADMLKGIAPYIDILKNLVLPPRYEKGDPRNLERVKAVSQALHKAKTGV
jgi:hypothetical protein